MKYFIVIIALSFSAPALAAPEKTPVTHCWATFADAQNDIEILWSESLVSTGIRNENGFVVNRFANPNTRSWTRTDTSPGGIMCITDAGINYEGPLPRKKK